MGLLCPKDASVKFDRLTEGGTTILRALARQARRSTWDWVITCGTESHPMSDPHSRGDAYDVSVANFPNSQAIVRGFESLKQELGTDFTVLFEVRYPPLEPELHAIAYLNEDATGKHFHLQVRKGTTYPHDEGTVIA